jgi:hypothetical protein
VSLRLTAGALIDVSNEISSQELGAANSWIVYAWVLSSLITLQLLIEDQVAMRRMAYIPVQLIISHFQSRRRFLCLRRESALRSTSAASLSCTPNYVWPKEDEGGVKYKLAGSNSSLGTSEHGALRRTLHVH